MTSHELRDWYYGEVEKLGLSQTDVETIYWMKDPDAVYRECVRVPFPDGKTREQLEEIIAELKTILRIEPKD
jgi:hypothetical protein